MVVAAAATGATAGWSDGADDAPGSDAAGAPKPLPSTAPGVGEAGRCACGGGGGGVGSEGGLAVGRVSGGTGVPRGGVRAE